MAKRAAPDPIPDRHCLPRDSVDRLVADWRAVRPELDFSPVLVVSRLGRVRAHLDDQIEGLLARHGVSGPSFAVLVTLVRLQQPDGVPQRRLMEELGLTSGTVSVRIDRLVADGLVARRSGREDRRNTQITLTDRGRDLFEKIVPAHLENERRLLSGLSEPEKALLADLLRKLLVEFEGSLPPVGATLRLGLALAPAHMAIGMRQAVGLPPVIGLLVREVEEDGPAAVAGVHVGDVVLRVAGRPLASIAALYAAIAERARTGLIALEIVRGVEEISLSVHLGRKAADEGIEPGATAGRAPGDRHRI